MSESVGNAYLNVVPRVDGDAKSLGTKFGNELNSGASSALSAGAVALGNILSDVIQSVASFAGEQLGQAFLSYANYEQLIGGVETLFKDASQTVQENAKQAFKTAGMSANEYMENVTSFSASLISSLDGDTVKAAEVADRAIVDMSDNANKMGTDIGRITDAYQGFAKQNYTMLDNLKLGYGGTKQEMERLLADASKIAGVQFNIDSYADVIDAIHVMQESMGITGTTMQEGSSTISGSINQLKGAWSNFLTALGDGGKTVDMQQVTQDLITSLGIVAENVIPVIQQIGASIAAELPMIVSMAFDGLAETVRTMLVDAFGENAGTAFDSFVQTMRGVADNIGQFKSMFEDAMRLIGEIVSEVWPRIQEVITRVMNTVGPALQKAWPAIKNTITNVLNILLDVFDTVWPAISQIVGIAMDAITTAIRAIEPLVSFIAGVFDGIKAAIQDPIGTAQRFIADAINNIRNLFNFNIQWPHIPLPHFEVWGSPNPLDWLEGGLPGFSIEWYGKGGFANQPTLSGYGEKGTELYWPGYAPYFDKYAQGIAEHLPAGAGGVDIHDCTFNVREEHDIRRIANELNTLINRQAAGGLA